MGASASCCCAPNTPPAAPDDAAITFIVSAAPVKEFVAAPQSTLAVEHASRPLFGISAFADSAAATRKPTSMLTPVPPPAARAPSPMNRLRSPGIFTQEEHPPRRHSEKLPSSSSPPPQRPKRHSMPPHSPPTSSCQKKEEYKAKLSNLLSRGPSLYKKVTIRGESDSDSARGTPVARRGSVQFADGDGGDLSDDNLRAPRRQKSGFMFDPDDDDAEKLRTRSVFQDLQSEAASSPGFKSMPGNSFSRKGKKKGAAAVQRKRHGSKVLKSSKSTTTTPKDDRFRFKSFYKQLDELKLNYHQQVSQAQETLSSFTRFDGDPVKDLEFTSQNDKQTFLITRHGVESSADYFDCPTTTSVSSASASRFHTSLFSKQGDDDPSSSVQVSAALVPDFLEVTYLGEKLDELSKLIKGPRFTAFATNLMPHISSLPLLLLGVDEVYSHFREFLRETENADDLSPIMELAHALARDLQDKMALSFLTDILRAYSLRLHQSLKRINLVTEMFRSISGLLYNARLAIHMNFSDFLDVYISPFLLHRQAIVRQFFSEGLAYVLRGVQMDSSKDPTCLRSLLTVLTRQMWKAIESIPSGEPETGDKEIAVVDDDEDAAVSIASDSDNEETPKEAEEASSKMKLVYMVDSLSTIYVDIIKSVQQSVTQNKAEFLLHYLWDQWRASSSKSAIPFMVLKMVIAKVKKHLVDWNNHQVEQLLEQFLMNVLSTASDDQSRWAILALEIQLLAESPNLWNLVPKGVSNEVLANYHPTFTRNLRTVQRLLEGLSAVDAKSFSILSLSKVLSPMALSEWILSYADSLLFSPLEITQSSSASRNLIFRVLEVLTEPETARNYQGIHEGEEYIAVSPFQKVNKLANRNVTLAALIRDVLVRFEETDQLRQGLDPADLAAITFIINRCNLSDSLPSVDNDISIEMWISKMEGSQNIHEAVECFSNMAMRSLGDDAAFSKIVKHVLDQCTSVTRQGEFISATVPIWRSTGTPPEISLLKDVGFANILRMRGDLTVSFLSLSPGPLRRFASYLISCLLLPPPGLRAAANELLQHVFRAFCAERTLQPESKKRKLMDDALPGTEPKSLEALVNTLFKCSSEILTTPDTYETTRSQIHLVERFGEAALNVITSSRDSDVDDEMPGLILRYSFNFLICVLTGKLTPLWPPAAKSLVDLYQAIGDAKLQSIQKSMVVSLIEHFVGLINALVQEGICLSENRMTAFISPHTPKKLRSKLDGVRAMERFDVGVGDVRELMLGGLGSEDCSFIHKQIERQRSILLYTSLADVLSRIKNLGGVLTEFLKKTRSSSVKTSMVADEMSIVDIIAQLIIDVGHATTSVPLGGWNDTLSPNVELLTHLLEKVSFRKLGVTITQLLSSLVACGNSAWGKLTDSGISRLECLASMCLDSLLGIPDSSLQTTILKSLRSITLPKPPPTLKTISSISEQCFTALCDLAQAQSRAFKTKARELQGILKREAEAQAKDLMVQLCYSRLSEKGEAKKSSDQNLLVSNLTSLDPEQVTFLISLMVAGLFIATNSENLTLRRTEMVRSLKDLLKPDRAAGLQWSDFSFSEGRTLTFTLATSIPCNLQSARLALSRLRAFIALLDLVMHNFRQTVVVWIPFLSRLIARELNAMFVWDCAGSKLPEIRRHLVRDLVKSVSNVFRLYPSLEESCHFEILDAVEPTLTRLLKSSIQGKNALAKSALLKLISESAMHGERRFVVERNPHFLDAIFRGMAQPAVIEAITAGKPAAVVTEGLAVLQSLWEDISPSEKVEKEAPLPKREQRSKRSRDDLVGSSSDEEIDAHVAVKGLSMTEKIGNEVTAATAAKILDHHLMTVLRSLRLVLQGKLASKKNAVGSELKLLVGLASQPRLRHPRSEDDLGAALELCTILRSLLPSNPRAKYSQKSSKTAELIARSILVLLPSISQLIRLPSSTSVFEIGSEIEDEASGFLRNLMQSILRMFEIADDANCREAFAELGVACAITFHTTCNPVDFIELMNQKEHPSRCVRRDAELPVLWHPDGSANPEGCTNLVKCSLRIPAEKGDAVNSHWDYFLTRVFHGLNCQSQKAFNNEADADVQVSLLGSLVRDGFMSGVSETSLSLWPSKYIEQFLRHLLFFTAKTDVDLGVQIALSRCWDMFFERVERLGCVSQFVQDSNIDINTLEDRELWQSEWILFSQWSRVLSDSVIPFCTRSVGTYNKHLVEKSLQILSKLVRCLAPYATRLPHFVPDENHIPPLFSGLEKEQSLGVAFWTLQDLIPLAIRSRRAIVLDGNNLLTAFTRAVVSEGVIDHMPSVLQETIIKEHGVSGLETFNILDELTKSQNVSRIAAFKILRTYLSNLSNWTLTKVVIPLSIMEAVQKDAMTQVGRLSEEAGVTLIAALKCCPFAESVKVVQSLFHLHKTALPEKGALIVRLLCRVVGGVSARISQWEYQLTHPSSEVAQAAQESLAKAIVSLRKIVVPLLRSITITPPRFVKGKREVPKVLPEAVAALLTAASHFPPDEFQLLLPPLINQLALTLRSKEVADRKGGRLGLRMYVQALGPKCLPQLVQELSIRLSKGNHQATLTVAIAQILQAVLPIKSRTRQMNNPEAVKAIIEVTPLVMNCLVEELARVADPSDTSAAVDTPNGQRKLMETRKRQTPELTRVEGPIIVATLAANLPIEKVEHLLIPGLLSLMNPSVLLAKSTKVNSSMFSSKYLRRCIDILRAAFKGVTDSPNHLLDEKLTFLSRYLEVSCILIVEQGTGKEINSAFPNLSSRTLQEMAAEADKSSLVEKVLAALGRNSNDKPLDPKTRIVNSRAQAKRDAFYTVQPGAAAGLNVMSVFSTKKKRVYEQNLQGESLGTCCLKGVEALLPQIAVDVPDCQMLVLVNLIIDCYTSGVGEFANPAGKSLWRLQKLLSRSRQDGKGTIQSPQLQEVERLLLERQSRLGIAIVRAFMRVPPRLTIDQARFLVTTTDLVKYFLTSSGGEFLAHQSGSPSPSAGPPNIQGALLAFISQICTTPYHTSGIQSLKVAAIHLYANIMEYFGRRCQTKDEDGNPSLTINVSDFQAEEITSIYTIADELIKILTQQAGFGLSYGNVKSEGTLIHIVRYALVKFLKLLPLSPKAFDARIDKLLVCLDFEEAEGRRAVINVLAACVKEMPLVMVKDRLAAPMWLMVGQRLAKEPIVSTERKMLKELLRRLLDRMGAVSICRELTALASNELRSNPAALLELTLVSLEFLLIQKGLEGVQRQDLARQIAWTAGSFLSSEGVGDTASMLFGGLTIPNVDPDKKRAALVALEIFCLLFVNSSPKFSSWLTQPSSQAAGTPLAPVTAALFGLVWEGFTSKDASKVLGPSAFAAAAALIKSGLKQPSSPQLALFLNDWSKQNIAKIGQIKLTTNDGPCLAVDQLSLRVREMFLREDKDAPSTFFDSYRSGVGECSLALIVLGCQTGV